MLAGNYYKTNVLIRKKVSELEKLSHLINQKKLDQTLNSISPSEVRLKKMFQETNSHSESLEYLREQGQNFYHVTPIFFSRIDANARIPVRESAGTVAYNIYSVVEKIINPKQNSLIRTGLKITLPAGYYGIITGKKNMIGIESFPVLISPDYGKQI